MSFLFSDQSCLYFGDLLLSELEESNQGVQFMMCNERVSLMQATSKLRLSQPLPGKNGFLIGIINSSSLFRSSLFSIGHSPWGVMGRYVLGAEWWLPTCLGPPKQLKDPEWNRNDGLVLWCALLGWHYQGVGEGWGQMYSYHWTVVEFCMALLKKGECNYAWGC